MDTYISLTFEEAKTCPVFCATDLVIGKTYCYKEGAEIFPVVYTGGFLKNEEGRVYCYFILEREDKQTFTVSHLCEKIYYSGMFRIYDLGTYM